MNKTILLPESVKLVALPELPAEGTRTSAHQRADRGAIARFPSKDEQVPIPATIPLIEPRSGFRRFFFRCVRLLLTGAVLAGVGSYVKQMVISATSEQAYINAEMTLLRSPIDGQLRLNSVEPSSLIPKGATVFTIQNPRFGNQEVNSQMNWLRELAERLQAEADEAAVRLEQQEQVYRLHERLHEQKLISNLEFIEEQTKLALVGTAATNKLRQAVQAQARAQAVERQLDLQKTAVVQMPFDGVAWTVPARDGAEVGAHDPVVQVIDPKRIWVDAFFHERHANKLRPGTVVHIRSLDGKESWKGRVESMRAGVGRIAYENFAAGLPGDSSRRRIAVRVSLEWTNPYESNQFFGVGRSVVVSLIDHE
jgi:multidrug resistance efflux pump